VNKPYFLISADGSRTDTLAILPTRTVAQVSTTELGFTAPTFARNAPPTAVFDRQMYWGNGDSFDIHIFDLSGNTHPEVADQNNSV